MLARVQRFMEKDPQGAIVGVAVVVVLAAIIHFSYADGLVGFLRDGTDFHPAYTESETAGTSQ